MNRRNVLFVLGTTILLGGALIASGAFSQVEAQRDVTVQTAGDADAALGIELNETYSDSNYVSNGSGKAITIEFTDVNDNATIYFDDLLDITNNGNQTVNLNASTSSDAIMVYDDTSDSFVSGGSSISGDTLNTGDTGQIGIAINTSKEYSGSHTITIEANRQS